MQHRWVLMASGFSFSKKKKKASGFSITWIRMVNWMWSPPHPTHHPPPPAHPIEWKRASQRSCHTGGLAKFSYLPPSGEYIPNSTVEEKDKLGCFFIRKIGLKIGFQIASPWFPSTYVSTRALGWKYNVGNWCHKGCSPPRCRTRKVPSPFPIKKWVKGSNLSFTWMKLCHTAKSVLLACKFLHPSPSILYMELKGGQQRNEKRLIV